MADNAINLRPDGESAKHAVQGRHDSDCSVGGITMLLHRSASLSEWSLQDACNDFWRLYRPTSVGGQIHFQGKTIKLKPGNLYVVPPNTSFDSECLGEFNTWYTYFQVSGLCKTCRSTVVELPIAEELSTLVDRASPSPEQWQSENEPDISPLDALTLAFHVVQRALPQLEFTAGEDPSLQRCIEFLREHMANKITLSDLSEQVQMSSRNLSKVFRDGVGTTPMRFLLKLRLNHSMKLLRHTDDTVEMVAEKCGFPDRYYFTRMLKKYRNTTPAAFRKNGRPREGGEEEEHTNE